MVEILSQCINISNHDVINFKYFTVLSVISQLSWKKLKVSKWPDLVLGCSLLTADLASWILLSEKTGKKHSILYDFIYMKGSELVPLMQALYSLKTILDASPFVFKGTRIFTSLSLWFPVRVSLVRVCSSYVSQGFSSLIFPVSCQKLNQNWK